MATDDMGMTLPTIDGSSGTWDTELNAALEIIDNHDHSSGNGRRISQAGLLFTADLTFSGFGATNVKRVGFTNQANAPGNSSLWTKTSDNELYFTNSAGTDIKITSGTGLNMSLVGGITGDYAAASASFYYDDANATYRALNAAPLPNDWAALACGNIDLYEKASGITTRVRLSSPASLAASYALTFPAALPAGKRAVQCSSAGALTFDNAFSGAATFDSTIVATGDITGADLHHTDAQVLFLPASQWTIPNGSTGRLQAKGHAVEILTHTGAEDTPTAVCGIPLKTGDTITQVVVRLDKVSGSGDVRVRLRSYAFGTGVTTTHATGTWSAGTNITLSGLSVGAGSDVWVQVEGGGTTGDNVYQAEVSYTRAP